MARIALEQARARGFALKAMDVLKRAAMRADRAVRPTRSLKELAGLVRILEDRIVEFVGHGSLPSQRWGTATSLSSIYTSESIPRPQPAGRDDGGRFDLFLPVAPPAFRHS